MVAEGIDTPDVQLAHRRWGHFFPYALPAGAAMAMALWQYSLINVSGMSPIGMAINSMAILVLIIAGIRKDFLLVFFVVNIILGPLLLFNDAGSFWGRTDFALSLALAVPLAASSLHKSSAKAPLMLVALLGSIMIPMLLLGGDGEGHYRYVGSVCVSFVLAKLLSSRMGYSKLTIYACMTLIVANTIVGVLQMAGIDLSLRGGYYSALSVAGVLVTRPFGFFGASYVFGIYTIFLNFVVAPRLLSGFRIPKLLVAPYLGLVVAISSFASRAVLLAFVLAILFQCVRNLGRMVRWATVLVAVILVVGKLSVDFLDQSNVTKLVLWSRVASGFVEKPFLEKLFGSGPGSSSTAATSGITVSILGAGDIEGYHHEINDPDGFPIHNVYLQIFYECGMVGLAVIMAGVVAAFLWAKKPLFFGFALLAASIHYFFHNGIFQFPLISLIFLRQFAEMRDQENGTPLERP